MMGTNGNLLQDSEVLSASHHRHSRFYSNILFTQISRRSNSICVLLNLISQHPTHLHGFNFHATTKGHDDACLYHGHDPVLTLLAVLIVSFALFVLSFAILNLALTLTIVISEIPVVSSTVTAVSIPLPAPALSIVDKHADSSPDFVGSLLIVGGLLVTVSTLVGFAAKWRFSYNERAREMEVRGEGEGDEG